MARSEGDQEIQVEAYGDFREYRIFRRAYWTRLTARIVRPYWTWGRGGATATDVVGYWQSPGGLLAKEKVTLAYAFCQDLEVVFDGLLGLVLRVKAQAGQESIAFEVDNELYLI